MEIKAVLLIFLFWLLTGSDLYGQEQIFIRGKSVIELRKESLTRPRLSFETYLLGTALKKESFLTEIKATRIPQVYSFEHLPIFCKIEVQLERAVRLPVKIRLGDVQYVDWLEGKRPLPGSY